ncbi:hypothetical protein BDZ97DRAFT_290798 [Flammula alnicola]|nr:hypothetical protein BDZ97DRAFT_572969 [Flammula alnicola]KAF8955410.1 hypothetical protein BDZ97DRAFT_290798 [Flammula alnicola]
MSSVPHLWSAARNPCRLLSPKQVPNVLLETTQNHHRLFVLSFIHSHTPVPTHSGHVIHLLHVMNSKLNPPPPQSPFSRSSRVMSSEYIVCDTPADPHLHFDQSFRLRAFLRLTLSCCHHLVLRFLHDRPNHRFRTPRQHVSLSTLLISQ